MSLKNTVDFTVDVKGDLTDKQYTGTFEAKTKLSVRETLKQDEIYRSIVGANSAEASVEAKSMGTAIAYLITHVIKSPDWWRELDNGMKVDEMNLLAEVFQKCQSAIDAEYKKLQEEANVAEVALKAMSVVTG